MKVAVAGASGLIGSALVSALRNRGDEVVILRRQGPPREGTRAWDPPNRNIDVDALDGVDVVVNLAGESIGARRWTASQRGRILDSRVDSTELLAETIARGGGTPTAFLNASAVGFYGSRGDEVLTEESGPGDGFLAGVCRRWEEATRAAARAGCRVVLLRTGVVLASRGGVLQRQLPLFRRGLGGVLGSGRQYVSWVAIDDAVRAILRLAADDSIHGAVNVTAPDPVTNREFTDALAGAFGGKARLRVPSVALRVALGSGTASELLLASQRAVPERLAAAGFTFTHTDVARVLAHVVGSESANA